MSSLYAGISAALWLGILTSISPCPLTTNIAAVTYIGHRIANTRMVVLSGIAYSCGRMIAYATIAAVVTAGMLSIPAMSEYLQRYMIMIAGPVLIIVGMLLLELIGTGLTGPDVSGMAHRIGARGGIVGAGLLGMLFAVSFCPVSAALFFGSLIPLSVVHGSHVLFPAMYGLGTALPVLLVAIVAASGAKSIGLFFKHITVFEQWARRITGCVFVGAGVYLTLKYVFEVL